MAKASKDNKDLLVKVRACHKKATEADDENRTRALNNIKFARIPGMQWSDEAKKDRGDDRLMLEFNKVKVQCKRVINEMRANRPQGKIRGYEDNDKDTAETMEGLARNICNVSKLDSICDYQAEYQVQGGYGVWEIVTDYSSDTAFDQDILIKNIPNPFCVWSDPAAKDMMKQDAMWWIKTEKIRKSEYEARWPKREVCDFGETEFDDNADWEEEGDDGMVRICEYWYKVPAVRNLGFLQDGKTVDLDKEQVDPAMILKQRKVNSHKIMMAICSGDAILEGPNEWAGVKFPFVPVYGDYLIIDGQVYWSGMVQDLKDAQRADNAHLTNIVETVESATKAKYWATPAQVTGLETAIAEAHKKNFPVAVYNPDPQAPGPPAYMPGGEVPVALMQSAQIMRELMDSLAGFTFDPSGASARNISGKALNARERNGQIATFNYPDNMGKAMQLTWEILIDLIPKIYDTERSVRILGQDGAEKFTKINARDPATGQIVNDLSRGKFDVTVTVGPSYATQRMEAVEAYTEIATRSPEMMTVAGDLVFKNMDLPGADAISERMKYMLAPPIQKMLAEDAKQSPEVQQAMQQVEQMSAMVDEKGKLVEAAAVEAQEEVNAATKAKAELDKKLADIKIAEANFKTMEANFKAEVAAAKAELQSMATDVDVREHKLGLDSERVEEGRKHAEGAVGNVEKVIQAVLEETQEFMAQAAEVVVKRAEAIQAKPDKPKLVGLSMKRDKGKKIAVAKYEDGSESNFDIDRVNGDPTATLQ
jgi:hypothetical protein